MANYRLINTRFWIDSYIAGLNMTERGFFLYCLTNPSANISGIYELSYQTIAGQTGLKKDEISALFEKLAKDDKIFYFEGWIIIKNFIKHQSISPNIIKGIIRSLNETPPYIQAIIENFQEIRKELEAARSGSKRLEVTRGGYQITLGNSKKLEGASRDLKGLEGTQRDLKGLEGTSRDFKGLLGTRVTKPKRKEAPPYILSPPTTMGGRDKKEAIIENDIRLSKLLLDIILKKNPNFKKPKKIESWAGHIRLMREQDKRPIERIEEIIYFSQQDPFWQSHILSTKKLRDKFDTLVMQANRKSQGQQLGKFPSRVIRPEQVKEVVKGMKESARRAELAENVKLKK